MKDDPIKKIFGKTVEEIMAEPYGSHVGYHSSKAFCGTAGPEELNHLSRLIELLDDDEVVKLAKRVGIGFKNAVSRLECVGVLDQAEREVFYREFHKLLEERVAETS